MCPGLTSPGGALDDEVEAETPVVWTLFACVLVHDCFCNVKVLTVPNCLKVFRYFYFLSLWLIWYERINTFWSVSDIQNWHSQAILADGKQHALAIGFTKMSAKDM